MGRNKREIPKKLGAKLKAVRSHLDLSQTGMLKFIKPNESPEHRSMISEFEKGTNLPDCSALLTYARAAGISVETLIDDSIELDLLTKKAGAKTNALSDKNPVQTSSTDGSEPLFALIQLLIINNLASENRANNKVTAAVKYSDLINNDLLNREAISVELVDKFLDEIDDLYLDFLRETQRHLRPQMTREHFYRVLFLGSVNDFNDHRENSYVMRHWRKLTEALSQNSICS